MACHLYFQNLVPESLRSKASRFEVQAYNHQVRYDLNCLKSLSKILYDVTEPDSFDNIFDKYYPEYLDNTQPKNRPICVILGNKCDMRDNPATQVTGPMTKLSDNISRIEKENSGKAKDKMKIHYFHEVSAMLGTNVGKAWENFLYLGFRHKFDKSGYEVPLWKNNSGRFCVIL